MHFVELFAQSLEGALEPIGGHSLFDQLLYGPEPNEIAAVLEVATLLFLR